MTRNIELPQGLSPRLTAAMFLIMLILEPISLWVNNYHIDYVENQLEEVIRARNDTRRDAVVFLNQIYASNQYLILKTQDNLNLDAANKEEMLRILEEQQEQLKLRQAILRSGLDDS